MTALWQKHLVGVEARPFVRSDQKRHSAIGHPPPPQTASDLTAQRAFGQQWQEIAQAAGKNDLVAQHHRRPEPVGPDMARLQELMTAGARQPMDFGGNIIRAVKELDVLAARGGDA